MNNRQNIARAKAVNAWRRFVFKAVVKLIRKYFPDGVSVITNSDEDIIAYRWTWTRELEKEIFRKRA